MKVAVCVLSWRRTALTERCLRSLLPDGWAVYWLAQDPTPEDVLLAREMIGLGVVALPGGPNEGFSGPMNFLVDMAFKDGADVAIPMNNDIVAGFDLPLRLGSAVPDGCAALAPLTTRGGLQVVSAHNPQPPMARGETWDAYDRRLCAANVGRYVPILHGGGPAWSCVAVPRSAWEAVGPLDAERLPVYGSDTDWCWRAWKLGLTTGAWTGALVHHDHGGSTTRVQNRRLRSRAVDAINAKWGTNLSVSGKPR